LFKSEAEVTNNNRLRSRYCSTVEADYRQSLSRGLSATAELLVLCTDIRQESILLRSSATNRYWQF